MPRAVLDASQIHAAVRERVAGHHAATVNAAREAVASHPVVVLGMAGNPFVRKARKALDAAGIDHFDLDHGSYLSQWRRRNALKMWCGWPTFPMVFIQGQLVGGADDLAALIASGELSNLLARTTD